MVRMRRIPAGSIPATDEFEEGGEDALRAFSGVFDPVMQIVHDAVEDYVNDDSLTFDSSENYQFPVRSQLAGEYYISELTYGKSDIEGQDVYWCSVMACCTGRIIADRADISDYLGLDVMVTLPLNTVVPRLYSVDSSAI